MGIQGKKCLFFVQGEGRGHMTQSISMKQILEKAGMEVCEVIIGKSSHRQIPQFYYDRMKVPVTMVDSPTITMDKNLKSARAFGTFLNIVKGMPKFFASLSIINEKIKEHKPDLVVNFFEPLCGAYYMFYRPQVPMISVAHHHLYNHPDFKMPEGQPITKFGLRLYSWFTSFRAKKKLALSFYPFDDSTRNSIFVVPPLLRSEVLEYPTQKQNYLLVYLLNSGYMEDIISWHKRNPMEELHCFVDKKTIKDVEAYDDKLFFHQLDDRKFLQMMANAKGLITTAGFESVCEAMYMDKPVLMVPVDNHYEQYCNSRDATKAGAGIPAKTFEIDKLLNYIPTHNTDYQSFKDWVRMSPFLILRQVHSVLYAGDNVRQLFPQMALQKNGMASV
jgi:uncharacterized protein (TIGR00661 family)